MYIHSTSMTAISEHGLIRSTALNRSLWCLVVSVGLLSGCSNRPLRTTPVNEDIRSELSAPAKATVPENVSDALLDPAPTARVIEAEPRLDLLVSNAKARDVFLALVADTRYSMLMHPDVKGSLSVTLRGVTVKEALESIRDVYGYDFRIVGRRITVYGAALQTRIFTVNYPHSQRLGSSELRVSSGASRANPSGQTAATGSAGDPQSQQSGSSRVSTNSSTDLWSDLAEAIRSMVGKGNGRNVIVSPQAGIIAVRAMPDELRQVEYFLKATQVAVERQVMLEAKIVEVELRDGYQSGINWGAFATNASGDAGAAIGVLGSGIPQVTGGAAIPGVVPTPSLAAGGGLFGLALATSKFASVMGFLETQGDVQTLSSPRVATLNNQKALLKVGSDDYYVTNVTGGTTNSSGVAGVAGTTTMPTLTLTSFFSGVALDVTPQIDADNNIMLHVHPSVTTVTEKNKEIDLGSMGQYRLPLASSSVNETDTLVRIQDGNIVAIGGLMQSSSARNASGVPGTTNASNPFSFLFGNNSNTGRKKELVVLIKPSIIRTAEDWELQTQRSRAALEDIDAVRSRVIRLGGGTPEESSKGTGP